jgi:putative addiction module component (TIGR02574 family)
MSKFEEVLAAARGLNSQERLRLVEALWEDSSPAEWPVPSEEWIAEARRRSAEYDRGNMPAAPWSEVRTRTRRKAALDG